MTAIDVVTFAVPGEARIDVSIMVKVPGGEELIAENPENHRVDVHLDDQEPGKKVFPLRCGDDGETERKDMPAHCALIDQLIAQYYTGEGGSALERIRGRPNVRVVANITVSGTL